MPTTQRFQIITTTVQISNRKSQLGSLESSSVGLTCRGLKGTGTWKWSTHGPIDTQHATRLVAHCLDGPDMGPNGQSRCRRQLNHQGSKFFFVTVF
jgi:hypothetical protein